MPKILWVALPLLLAALVLAVQAIRRRPPSRHAINVVSSVLLLLYVATTAGLGIFWVANQQLPVFDWHYLFGYGTVLLVSLHLVFNFPAVWRFFTRRLPAAEPSVRAPAMRPARRGMLTAMGGGAAAVAAFVLGLRHGRSDLRIEPPAGGAPSDPKATALALVERFHAFSSHSRRGVMARAPGVDWGDPPPAFKRLAGTPRMSLPRPGTSRGGRFDVAALADVLWHTTGVSDTRGGLNLRTSPSSGALFSTELYVAVRAMAGLSPGRWHYDPQTHALARLRGTVDAATGDAPVSVVATAVFRRTGHKYRDRTYRYVLADLGHALENLRVAAVARGVPVNFGAAFDEARMARALELDEGEEGVLALIGLGATVAASAASTAVPAWDTAPWQSAEGAPLGVTAAVHAASSLRAATAPASIPSPPAASAAPANALPKTQQTTPDWLRLISARRSVRRYAGTPLTLDMLSAVLWHMAVRHSPVLSSAVRVNVVVHAVDGLQPGAYRYLPARHALLPSRVGVNLRNAARAAALDQDVIGDAAAVFVLAIDRAAFAADPHGPARGYRHAFIEAGLVGERVYLEAGAQGLGACAVGAFYDDEAAALVDVDPAREWIVHFAALGIKA